MVGIGYGLPLTTVPTEVEDKFLAFSAGASAHWKHAEANHIVRHLKKRMLLHFLKVSWDDVLSPELLPPNEPFQRLLSVLSKIATIYKDNRSSPPAQMPSVDKIYQSLVKDNLISSSADEKKAKQLIFALLSCLTFLYVPKYDPESPDALSIDQDSAAYPENRSVSAGKTERPINELIRSLGETLPRNKPLTTSNLHFHVSSLNASTLYELGEIEIVWTDTVSSHLYFDTSCQKLYIFRSPSLSKLWENQESIFTILTQHHYAAEAHKPSTMFTTKALANELRLSYKLIFGNSKKGRQSYRRRERVRAAIDGAVDPLLDELCRYGYREGWSDLWKPLKETAYEADTHFPIFRHRLLMLQKFMDGIEPNSFFTVWKDRRDLRLWVTIWVVLILGIISIVIAVIGLGLSAAQLKVAEDALELDRQQGSS